MINTIWKSVSDFFIRIFYKISISLTEINSLYSWFDKIKLWVVQSCINILNLITITLKSRFWSKNFIDFRMFHRVWNQIMSKFIKQFIVFFVLISKCWRSCFRQFLETLNKTKLIIRIRSMGFYLCSFIDRDIINSSFKISFLAHIIVISLFIFLILLILENIY